MILSSQKKRMNDFIREHSSIRLFILPIIKFPALDPLQCKMMCDFCCPVRKLKLFYYLHRRIFIIIDVCFLLSCSYLLSENRVPFKLYT